MDSEGYSNRLYTSQIAQNKNYVGQLYDYGARFLNVRTGRFVSPDVLTDDGLNRYGYVRSNPLKFKDPSGHCAALLAIICGAAIGGAIGAIGGAAIEYGSQVYANLQSGKTIGDALTANIDGGKIGKAAIAGGITGALIGGGVGAIVGTGGAAATLMTSSGILGGVYNGAGNVIGQLSGPMIKVHKSAE